MVLQKTTYVDKYTQLKIIVIFRNDGYLRKINYKVKEMIQY